MKTIVCKKHGKVKTYTNGICVECQKEKSAKWRAKNKRKVLLQNVEYRKKNKQKMRDYARKHYREKYQVKPEKYLIDENGVRKMREKIIRIKRKILRKQKMRFAALTRDKFTCQYCGRKAPDVILEVDHIHPRSKGGLDKLENYRTSCKDCNIGKSCNILEII